MHKQGQSHEVKVMAWGVLRPTDGLAFVLLIIACCYAWAKPMWDWDVIPYLALAKATQGLDWPAAHAWVYAWVNTLPEAWRTDLLGREFYRSAVASDVESLRQVSVFYQARIGYYGLLGWLNSLGIEAKHAVQGMNMVGQIMLGGTVWMWMRRQVTGRRLQVTDGLWMLFYAFMLFNPTVMKLARWSSPDGLVAACYVLGMYLLVMHRTRWAGLAWLVMVLLRPNTVLWLAPVGVWAMFQARFMVLPLLGVGGVAMGLNHLFPNYPLAVVWQHTFGFPYVYPMGVSLDWGWEVYRTTWLNRLSQLHGRDLVVWVIMFASLVWLWAKQAPNRWLAASVVAGGCLQVLAFPAFWERYFAGLAVVMVLLATPCFCTRKAV